MRRLIVLAAAVAAIACGSTEPTQPKGTPKPDPYLTIRILNHLDTTTTPGRSGWRMYVLLSGPEVNQNGVSYEGSYTMTDARFNHPLNCIGVGADSIGQRLVAPFAIADTLHPDVLMPIGASDSIAARWNTGNHANPPAGYMILTLTAFDAFNSVQYANGHGLTRDDPIKWAWDWTGAGATAFAERLATDTTSCNTL